MGFQMKRYNNLFEQIVSLDNLRLAEKKARKNKTHRPEVIEFDKNKEQLLLELQKMLIDGTYVTSPYYIYKIYEPKRKRNLQVAILSRQNSTPRNNEYIRTYMGFNLRERYIQLH